MATFEENITVLRKGLNKKRQEVADDLGISRSSLEYYEKGKRRPDIDVLAKLADYYGVSTDYLIGRTDAKTIDKDLRFICDYTGLSEEAIQSLCDINKDFKELKEKQNTLLNIPTEFVNVFLSGGTLHVLSLYASQYLIAVMKQITCHKCAIDIYKTDCVDKEKKLSVIDSSIKEGLDQQDLTLFRIQKTVLDYFESFMGDYEQIAELNQLRKQYKMIKMS